MAEGGSGSEIGGGASGDRARVEQAILRCRAGAGHQDDFTFLFERFGAQLERQFVRWGSAPEEARDLNQETFQRIFQAVESFQGTEDHLFESWVSWVWTIARTTSQRSARFQRAQKRPQNVESLDAVQEEGGAAVPPLPPRQHDQVEAAEAAQQVRTAIDELPEQERKCVLLFYYQERKIRQIAVILSLAEGTVKAHLNHARAKLKAGLQDRFDFEEDTDDRA